MIEIQFVNKDPKYNLIPKYDREADLLEVRNHEVNEFSYGIDIDGSIILDLDKNFNLVNFDLLIPQRFWVQTSDILMPNLKRIDSQIKFSKSAVDKKSFNLTIDVNFNNKTKILLIAFSNLKNADRMVILSTKCFAIVCENFLLGFIVKLK